MDQLQLYLNDQLVDLSDDNPIALTFQINNLAEVQNQQGNTSNRFKLPLTQRNRQILGFPDDIAFTTNLPYQQYQAKLIQDGLEIIPYGIAELNGIDHDAANITILSGNVDFFDAIGGKLYNMGDSTSIWSNYGQNMVWKPFDHTWNLDNAAGSQNNTEGWIYPVVDYGTMDAAIFSNPVDVRYQRPGFFIKTAIELLLKSSGYKATGSLLADPLYPLLIAQFSNGSFEHGTDYQNQPNIKGCQVSALQAQTFVHNSVTDGSNFGVIGFTNVISNPSGFWNNNTYKPTEIVSVEITLNTPKLRLQGRSTTNSPASLNIYITLLDSNANVNLATATFDFANGYTGRVSGSGNSLVAYVDVNNTTLSFTTTLSPATAEGIQITYEFLGLSGSRFTLYPGASLTIQPQNQTVQFGQTVQCERIFPDISQKDLLKDTLQRFGVICQTDNSSKTISFNSLRDIVNNIPIAKDWSSKCVDQGKQVSFQLGSYAQVNYMQYQTDENILPLKLGWSQINIADQTLPASATLIESPFGPSLNRPWYGGTIAQIRMVDNASGTNDFSIGVTPRILIDQKLDIGRLGKTVTFTDGSGNNRVINDIISTPYFYKPDAPEPETGYGPASLLFDDLRKKYYPELEKILTQTKKVVRYVLLTPRDILELDLLIPIYLQQDGAYYYINKIDAWRKGQPTKIELVKLG
jgi:hypothetical protein